MRFAAIDLGTNSFHLVIADTKRDGTFQVLESEKEMVRLGETGADMKTLAPQSIERGIQVLKRFKSIIASRNTSRTKAVATSAIREAENGGQFISRARAEAGIEVEIISGFEEGRLIYLGALQALNIFSKRIFLLDIGGGSAEYVVGEKGAVKYVNSLKIGAIRLTKRFDLSTNPTSRAIIECRKYIRGELAVSSQAIRALGFKMSVGTSGTILSIASLAAASRNGKLSSQTERMNGFSFSLAEVRAVVESLIAAGTAETRLAIPGLDPKRADIILGGALVLEESMRLLEIETMTVSKFALREGVIAHEIAVAQHSNARRTGRKQEPLPEGQDVRERSVRRLGERSFYDEAHGDHVAKLSLRLFDQTRKLHGLGAEERMYLYCAALLHDIGYAISHSAHHKHSYYIISHAELLGFTNEEIEIIANVARYHRKSHPKVKHEGFAKLATDAHRQTVRKLGGILRIADGLDRGHLQLVEDMRCSDRATGFKIGLIERRHAPRKLELEIWGAERKKQLFEEVFGKSVSMEQISRPISTALRIKKKLTAKRT